MAKFFVKNIGIASTPSDSNDGLDPMGFAIAAGTYTHATRIITGSAFEFITYTHQDGDQVYLTSADVNFTDGLYEIEEKVSNSQIRLVTTAGTGDAIGVNSSTGPFATIQQLVNSVMNGDVGVICADADYLISSAINVSTSASATSRRVITGAAGRGAEDGTRARIEQQTNGLSVFLGSTTRHWEFRHLDCKPTNRGVFEAFENSHFLDCVGNQDDLPSALGFVLLLCNECYAEQCTARFLISFNSQAVDKHDNLYVECLADRCSGSGFELDNTTGANPTHGTWIRCRATQCTNMGWDLQGNDYTKAVATLIECLADNNGSHGIQSRRVTSHIDHSMLLDNGGSGIRTQADDTAIISIMRSVIAFNVSYGIDDGATHVNLTLVERFNTYQDNGIQDIRTQALDSTSENIKTSYPMGLALESFQNPDPTDDILLPTGVSPFVEERIDWPDGVHFTIRARYPFDRFKGLRLGRMRTVVPPRDKRRTR